MTVGFPHGPAQGGPGSFQVLLEKRLRQRGWRVAYPDDDATPDVILVVGGTRRIRWLDRCKRRGTRIVLRLDGINWRHRVIWPGARSAMKAIAINRLTELIRTRYADQVVYQSEFVRCWWHKEYGPANSVERVIYNAVSLDDFTPVAAKAGASADIVIVEGNIQDDPATRAILWGISDELVAKGDVNRVSVVGGISSRLRRDLEQGTQLEVVGMLSRGDIPGILARNALFLPIEINPSCPNSVIEALAAGLPVVGFDTGSLAELVGEDAGVLVPYGGDPWSLEIPDVQALATAIRVALSRRYELKARARLRAEGNFGLDRLLNDYVNTFYDAFDTN